LGGIEAEHLAHRVEAAGKVMGRLCHAGEELAVAVRARGLDVPVDHQGRPDLGDERRPARRVRRRERPRGAQLHVRVIRPRIRHLMLGGHRGVAIGRVHHAHRVRALHHRRERQRQHGRHLAITAGRSLDLTRVLNAGRSVSSTALSRSSCACSRADSSVNTATAWSVGGASALPTTLARALMRLLSRIGKLSGSSPLWFLTWYIASSIAPSLVLSESARAAMSRAPACPRACPTTASIWPRTSRIRVTASLAAESRSRIWMRRSNCRCRSAVAYLTRGSSRTVNGC